jgi:HAD superfamily hydrolase (TIGR01450 family)
MKILLYSSMLLIFQKTTQGLLSRVMSRRTHSSHSALLLSPYSLLLDTPIQLRDITEIANRYDIFLFDQFGVLHDGMKPLPGALRTLEFLKQSNKTVAIVSNTSSREEKAGEKLRQLGFPSSLYDGGVITSGECAYKFISSRKEMKSCLWFTWKEYKGNPFIDGLDLHLSDIHHADFILFQGTEVLVGSSPSDVELGTFKDGMIDTFVEEILRIGVRRGIPAVCANMDLKAVTQEGVAYMPGVLMREYALLGGECVSFGKPFSVHFEAAILQAEKRHRQKYTIPASQKLRCIHIGDSIEHDIKGLG